ncbi:hypothetical protein MXD63_07860 [Frankia sp. Cpl3]|uniref:hypothetical protein n=1 Tax=Parafrankia colletiae TaxID=573497 RepID=UPI0010427241|nr:hypothetical protein [Parafrankia colletiae]MCK9899991.1 hypothetical protein [Frankia sp. Cpl3]
MAERACRALAQELSERRRWSRELAVVFASTDHPGLLEALVQCWLEKRYSGSGDVLLEAIRRNPNLPRPTGENPAVAIIRNRLDLLDVTDWQTVDVMLDCIEDRSLPGQGEECRRLLLRLPPGAARDHLCRRARRSPAGLAVMREAGWLLSDTEDRLLFFFLNRDLRSYAGMDPDGRLLRIAYRRSDPLTQSTIRQLVRELDTARTQPACAGSEGSEDAGKPETAVPTGDIERDWPGFVTFDLGDFSADVGCGAARAFAAPVHRTRTAPGRGGRGRRSGRGFIAGGGCGSDSAAEQVRKYGCGHEAGGCGGG